MSIPEREKPVVYFRPLSRVGGANKHYGRSKFQGFLVSVPSRGLGGSNLVKNISYAGLIFVSVPSRGLGGL